MATSGHSQVPQPGPFALPLDADLAKSSGSRAATLGNLELRIAVLERERRELQQELFEAAQVQRRLSAPRQLQRGPFDVASEVFPVRYLAGDFVSTLDIGAQTWIALGDISGKGLAAAMWFTHLVSLIRCHATADPHPAAVMSVLNGDLCTLQPDPPLTSLVLLVLDTGASRIEYCNAGHPAPLLLRRERQIESLEIGGPLLGVVSGASYAAAVVELRPGDSLLASTDGVLECRNGEDEEFGRARLARVALNHAAESAQAMLFSVLAALQDFAATALGKDDLTMLVVRHSGGAQTRRGFR